MMNRIIRFFQGLCIFVASLVVFADEGSLKPGGNTVRLSVVNTPEYSGLLEYLIPQFESESGYKVSVHSGSDVYERAKNGKADIVISHFGKYPVKDFILSGYGSWPKMVFSNQAAIIGPVSDPAGIKGMRSASGAIAKIAETNSKYLTNRIPGVVTLTEVLMHQAGVSADQSWHMKDTAVNKQAAKLASGKEAYFIWGANPFLKFKGETQSTLEILVTSDPILQRVMSSTLVNPEKVKGINVVGAEKLQEYLLKPETQAKISAFRGEGYEGQLWWPAARNN